MAKQNEDVGNLEGVGSQSFNEPKKEPTKERFLLYMDIMGFKDRVSREEHSKILENLESLSKVIMQSSQDNNLDCMIFSDSIVVFSNNNENESFRIITNIAKDILNKSLELGFPIKGAISMGNMTVNLSNQLIFGQPLIDAYLLEENLYFYGVVAHHTVEKFAKNNNEYYCDLEIFMKNGGKSKHFVLKCNSEFNLHVQNVRETVSGAPRKYIDNTNSLVNQMLT